MRGSKKDLSLFKTVTGFITLTGYPIFVRTNKGKSAASNDNVCVKTDMVSHCKSTIFA